MSTIENQHHWLNVAETELNGRRHTEHGEAVPAIRAARERLASQAEREAGLLTELATAQTRIAELEPAEAYCQARLTAEQTHHDDNGHGHFLKRQAWKSWRAAKPGANHASL